VLLPERNEVDLEDVPEEVRKVMTFVPLDSAQEALPYALTSPTVFEQPAPPLS
jgi:ATP-dependent Lon protease